MDGMRFKTDAAAWLTVDWRAVMLIGVLAGCASAPAASDDLEYGDRNLRATAETGILLGVVVDATIAPLADAVVDIAGPGAEVRLMTDAAGRFALDGLVPGLYMIEASKNGYRSSTASALVEADVQDPGVVKIVLPRDDSTYAFFLQHVWEGRLACATTGANWCALPHLYAGTNPADDDSVRFFWDEFMAPGVEPMHVSIDLAWTSTQAVSKELLQRVTATEPDLIALGRWNYTFVNFQGGASPVHFDIGEAAIKESHLGRTMGLNIETFVPTPGVAIDQDFTEFLTVFYRYAPPEDWRLAQDPTVPLPPR